MRILVVDDDHITLKIIQNRLKKANFECDAFFDSKKALDEYKKNHYDVVIADYQMPKIKGIEVLKTTKSLNPAVEVILITGYLNDFIEKEAKNNGAYSFYEKPLDMDKIVEDVMAIHKACNEQ